jgi:hypothetical protein
MDDLFKIFQPVAVLNVWAANIGNMGIKQLIMATSAILVTLGFLLGLFGTATMRLPFYTLLGRTLLISVLIGASLPIGSFTKSFWAVLYQAGVSTSTKTLETAVEKSGAFGATLGLIGMALTAGKMVGSGALKAKNLSEMSRAAAANGKDVLKWASALNQLIAPFWFLYLLVVVISGLTIYLGSLFLPLCLAFCMFQTIGGMNWISGWIRTMINAMAVMLILPVVFAFSLKMGWEIPMNVVNKGLDQKIHAITSTMAQIGQQEEAIVKAITSLGTDVTASVEAVKATLGGGLINNGLKIVGLTIETLTMFFVGVFAVVVGLIIGGFLLMMTDKFAGKTLGGAASGLAMSTMRMPKVASGVGL